MNQLLALYPRAWRRRYEEEFRELLAARPPTLRDRLDIVLGAVDARLHPQLAPEPVVRVPTAADRWLALACVVAGALFGIWGGIIAVATPTWGSAGLADDGLMSAAYSAGFAGMILAIGALLGLAYRHADQLGATGAFGAVLAALGFLVAVGGASAVSVLCLTGGKLLLAPGLARVVPSLVVILFTGATILLALAMFGFVGSDGQTTFWLLFALGYGPAWAILGLSLRHARLPSAISAPTAAEHPAVAPTPAGA
jgi:hypothetical protein